MTTFLDGPAKGQHLMLKRKVRFLRVVKDARSGKWDALDMPGDHPEPTEEIFAYQAVGNGGMCHINRSGGRGGFYSMQNYELIPDQPDDATLRDGANWVSWVEARAERLGLK